MTPEALASQALVSWINQQIPRGIPDVVCQGLPQLDVKHLLRGLKSLGKEGLDTAKVSLALDGFEVDEAGLNKIANSVGYKSHNGLADSLFMAARWRNDHRKYPIIIALSAGHERLVNTLQHFQRPGVRELVRALFDWAKSDEGLCQIPGQRALLEALSSALDSGSELGGLLGLDNVCEFLAEWHRNSKRDANDAPRLALPRLQGLLYDPQLFAKPNSLEQRLIKNREAVQKLMAAGPGQIAIWRAVVKSKTKKAERDRRQAVLDKVEAIRRTPSFETLSALTLEEALDLLQPAKPAPEPSDEKPAKEARTPDDEDLKDAAADALLDNRAEQLTEALDELESALKECEEQDASEVKLDTPLSGAESVRFEYNLSLLNWVRVFCNETVWGGFVETQLPTLAEALDRFESVRPPVFIEPQKIFEHDGTSYSLTDLLQLFDRQLAKLGFSDPGMTAAWKRFAECRISFLADLSVLTHEPLLLFAGRPKFSAAVKDYLEACTLLYSAIQRHYGQMVEVDDAYARAVLERVLALDVVQVRAEVEEGQVSYKAVLLPTHPLHLWRYQRLERVMRGLGAEISAEDREAIVDQCRRPDQFLSVLYVPGFPVGRGGNRVLPLANDLHGLAAFENYTNAYNGPDGDEALLATLRRFVLLYPAHARPLRLALVNPPEPARLLVKLLKVLSDFRSVTLSGLYIEVFATTEHAARLHAAKLFSGRADPETLRESHIPLPDKQEGFPRVLFVGTTGAGKTSLLRQLIGSDPDEDRFPSTAPAKTTIADIEVIQTEGKFEAAVTFFTEFQTQANVEECVIDAALAVLENAPTDKVADRFLSHRDQKFRLSYILGGWRGNSGDEQDEMSFEEASDSPMVVDEEGALTDADRAANREVISAYLDRIARLTRSVVAKLTEELGVDIKVAGPDRDVGQQLVEENFEAYLSQEETFHELVQDILENVLARFDLIDAGELRRRPSGWPELWLFSSTDRDEFIRHIRWFSSNYWPQFGRLLTPLVDGIRVRGPLFPDFGEGRRQLVLIDGQGLGHTPDSSSSVTTHVTRRFAQVDVILLVDNAQQPMQAAPLSVLRAVASSGHHRKLAVAFTHFDQIKGQNFQKFADKRAHLMASVLNALSSLRNVLGVSVVNAIEHGIDARCFMLGGVDRPLAKLPARAADYMKAQLSELIGFFGKAILPPPPAEARPVYDPTGIGFAVQDAVRKFQGPWLARLGIGTYEGYRKEHWTRVKALNRRIAGELDDEYDTLRPIADLAMQLRESISRFLNNPISWTRDPTDEEEAQMALDRIRQVIEIALRDLSVRRLVQDHLTDWRTAYDGPASRGPGSTFRRANAIQGIYDVAAPLPDAVMTTPSVAFLGEIRRIVTSAIEASGGEVRLSEAA